MDASGFDSTGKLMHKSFTAILLLMLLSGAGTAAWAQAADATVTLDQAVQKVQQDTGGRVLSAEAHRVGRNVKYFIKVLTPEGHVQKLVISSEAGKNPAAAPSTKNLPERHAGGKERN